MNYDNKQSLNENGKSVKDDQQKAVMYACLTNNLSFLQTLLKSGISTNFLYKKQIPINVAAFYGNINIVAALANDGADLTAGDNDWMTPLHWACLGGHKRIVQFLLSKGAEPNRRDKYWRTPMHCAAISQDFDCFILMSEKFFKNYAIPDRIGWNPLHHAAYQGSIEIVKYILTNSEIVNTPDRKGRQPLHYAVYRCFKEMIFELIQGGADVNASDKRGYSSLHVAACSGNSEVCEDLILKNVVVDSTNKHKNTPLHLAAKHNYSNVMQVLLRNNANATSENNKKQKPIHLLCLHQNDIDIGLNLLLQHCSSNVVDNKGLTPLHILCKKGNINSIKFLIKYNCNLNCITNQGNTALHFAIYYNHIDIVELIANHESSDSFINIKNNFGMTPLHMACATSNFRSIQILLTRNSDITAIDNFNNTPLHLLTLSPLATHEKLAQPSIHSNNSTDWNMIEKLCSKESLRIRNYFGHTALHVSIIRNMLSTSFAMILNLNVDLKLKDNYGRNILHYAIMGSGVNEICIHKLVESGLAETEDIYGFTPLHYYFLTMKEYDFDIVKLFTESIKDTFVKLNPPLIHILCNSRIEDSEITDHILSFYDHSQLPFDSFGNSPYHMLAKNLHLSHETWELVTSHYPNVDLNNHFNTRGLTPIHISSGCGNFGFIDYMAICYMKSNKLNPNTCTRNNFMCTSTIYAILSSNTKLVKCLTKYNIDYRFLDSYQNCLINYAIISRSVTLTNLIYNKSKFDINMKNVYGETALILACKNNTSPEMLQLLLCYQANLTLEDNSGYTALHWLCINGDVVNLKMISESHKMYELINTVEMNSSLRNISGLLHCAVYSKSFKTIKFLLKNFPRFDERKNEFSLTPLHHVISYTTSDNDTYFTELVKYYIEHHVLLNSKSLSGLTPFMTFIKRSVYIDFKDFFKHIDITDKDDFGNTALHLAVSNYTNDLHYIDVIFDNFDYNSILNAQNNDGDTALHLAVYFEIEEIVNRILASGADPNIINNKGEKAVFSSSSDFSCDSEC